MFYSSIYQNLLLYFLNKDYFLDLEVGLIMKTSPTNMSEWHLGGLVTYSWILSSRISDDEIDNRAFDGVYINIGSFLDWIFSNANY